MTKEGHHKRPGLGIQDLGMPTYSCNRKPAAIRAVSQIYDGIGAAGSGQPRARRLNHAMQEALQIARHLAPACGHAVGYLQGEEEAAFRIYLEVVHSSVQDLAPGDLVSQTVRFPHLANRQTRYDGQHGKRRGDNCPGSASLPDLATP